MLSDKEIAEILDRAADYKQSYEHRIGGFFDYGTKMDWVLEEGNGAASVRPVTEPKAVCMFAAVSYACDYSAVKTEQVVTKFGEIVGRSICSFNNTQATAEACAEKFREVATTLRASVPV